MPTFTLLDVNGHGISDLPVHSQQDIHVATSSEATRQSYLDLIHSDGIGRHWTFDDYPGLIERHPALVAGVLYRDHQRGRDDATVVVVRRVG